MLKNIFLLITLSSFTCFLYGILHLFYWDIEANICHMTYMYGYPQYMKIDVKADDRFSNYGLYYYYEGQPIDPNENYIFNGAPVIFIPGNAGSHKQVRSLASVALRKSIDYRMTKKLDYFSISFNEELNGLHGGFLEVQKSYLKICIDTVLKLYNTTEEQRIVLIGHSMGGVVAQTVLADDDMMKVINTILTISAPLNAPVVNFDLNMNEFYERNLWHISKPSDVIPHTQKVEDSKLNGAINKILLLSIGGGNRDLLVYEGLTMSKHLDLHAMTKSIPDVWLSCDHLSATWCLELMKVINRFLFSILDSEQNKAKIHKFINDKALRLANAYNFFAGKNFDHKVEDFVHSSSKESYIWDEDTRPNIIENYENKPKAIYYKMIPIDNTSIAMYIKTNLKGVNWIYGCLSMKTVKDTQFCAKAEKLTSYVFPQPNQYEAAYLDFSLIPNNNWTHIVIRIPNKKLTTLLVDIHKPKDRIFTIESNLFNLLTSTIAINSTPLGASYYRLILPDIKVSYQSLHIKISTQKCSKQSLQFSAKLSTPWAQGFEKYFQFKQKKAEFVISVPINAPEKFNTTYNPITLELFLDSDCQFTVSYQIAFGSIMGRIVRLYYGSLPDYIIALLLFALARQVTAATETYTTPFNILQIAALHLFLPLILVIAVLPLCSVWSPKSILLTFILYGTSFVITAVILLAIQLLLYLMHFLLHKLNFFTKPKWCGAILHIIAAVFLAVLLNFSGGLALCIGFFYYFVKLLQIYGKSAEKYKYISRQILLFALYLVLTLLNLPATIAALKSWQSKSATLTDPTLMPSLLAIACLLIFWQLDAPTNMYLNKFIYGILGGCTFFCIIYCQETVYRLSFVIAFVLVLMLMQHIFSIMFKF